MCIKLTEILKIKTPNTGQMWGNSILIPYTIGVEPSEEQ